MSWPKSWEVYGLATGNYECVGSGSSFQIYQRAQKTLNGVIQLASSGKWPDDLETIKGIKAAFYIWISKKMASRYKSTSIESFPDCIEELKNLSIAWKSFIPRKCYKKWRWKLIVTLPTRWNNCRNNEKWKKDKRNKFVEFFSKTGVANPNWLGPQLVKFA